MNIKEYKSAKRIIIDKSEQYREKCFNCFRPKKACLCNYISPFITKSRFIFLLHPMEAKKQRVGTGRITHTFLKESKMFVGVDFSNDKGVNDILDDTNNFCIVLYPGENAFNISKEGISNFTVPNNRQLVIIVIDGTWPCAKKMMTKSFRIRALPRICFTPKNRSKFIIKHQPHEMCLSTIESVHMFLDEMDRQNLEQLHEKHHKMLEAFDALNNYQINCANNLEISSYRRGSYKVPKNRILSKRWKTRKLFVK